MDRNLVLSRPFWVGSVASTALALVHPLYYLYYLGVLTPQVLNQGAAFHIPTLTEFGAPLVDLNIGLLVHANRRRDTGYDFVLMGARPY